MFIINDIGKAIGDLIRWICGINRGERTARVVNTSEKEKNEFNDRYKKSRRGVLSPFFMYSLKKEKR